jgi:hypothetical protein
MVGEHAGDEQGEVAEAAIHPRALLLRHDFE